MPTVLRQHSRSTSSRVHRTLICDLKATLDTVINEIQIVDFSHVVVGALILLLRHDVGTDVPEGTIRMQTMLVEIVRSSITHSLANWHFAIVLELVIVAAVDVA